MATVTRRRSSRDNEETTSSDERPTRRRGRSSDSMPEEERNTPRRRRGRDADEAAAEAPRRRRGSSSEDEGRGSRRRGSSGFGAYASKKVSTGDFAQDFKPGSNKPTLIKFVEPEPFDSYNQHWIDGSLPRDVKRRSYVCLDDEDYFDGETDCPLCAIGEKRKTFALFNIIDLSDSRKPEVKVWSASPAVADYLERASAEKKTSPINREDIYWEVELTEKNKRYAWVLTPIKARDLPEDFDMEPLEADEVEEFSKDLFEDRSAITKIDSYEDLQELADDLMN